MQRLIQLCIGSWSSGIRSLRHNTVRTHLRGTRGVAGTLGPKTMVLCLETGLALVWSVRMTEDPIPLDQDPMQSWIGVAHSGGLCTLDGMLVLAQFLKTYSCNSTSNNPEHSFMHHVFISYGLQQCQSVQNERERQRYRPRHKRPSNQSSELDSYMQVILVCCNQLVCRCYCGSIKPGEPAFI